MKNIYSFLLATTLCLISSCETTKAFKDQANQGKSISMVGVPTDQTQQINSKSLKEKN